jgi:hypothetical protein
MQNELMPITLSVVKSRHQTWKTAHAGLLTSPLSRWQSIFYLMFKINDLGIGALRAQPRRAPFFLPKGRKRFARWLARVPHFRCPRRKLWLRTTPSWHDERVLALTPLSLFATDGSDHD